MPPSDLGLSPTIGALWNERKPILSAPSKVADLPVSKGCTGMSFELVFPAAAFS